MRWDEFVREARARDLIDGPGRFQRHYYIKLPNACEISICSEARVIFELVKLAKHTFGLHEKLLSLTAHFREFLKSSRVRIVFSDCQCGQDHITLKEFLKDCGYDTDKL